MSIRSLRRQLLLVAGLGLAVSAAVPMLTAAAEPTSVTAALTGSATLIDKGAAVEIPFVYSCSTDTAWSEANLQVTERVPGNDTAQGWAGNYSLVCDGAQHTDVITVTPNNGNAFHTGSAFVQGGVYASDTNGYGTFASLAGTVDIKK